MISMLQKICNSMILMRKEWPQKLEESVITISLRKKATSGNAKISLIFHTSKLLLHFHNQFIKKINETPLDEAQAGFRKERSPMDQIYSLRSPLRKKMEHLMSYTITL